MPEPKYVGKVLFRGERKASIYHECDDCGRPICPGEYYRAKVFLQTRGDVLVKRTCCKSRV